MATRTVTVRPFDSLGDGGAVIPALRFVASVDRSIRDVVVPLDRAVSIGRSGGRAEIGVRDGALSGQHLRFISLPGGLAFEDLGSKNGSFVNGTPSTGGVLHEGDVVRAGDTCGVITRLTDEPSVEDEEAGLVGDAPAFRAACNRLRRGADSDMSVLLLGATGTGKEVMANLVHRAGKRRGRLVPVNCTAIPESLADASFFGHQKGAFTGADQARLGLFREADGGTLFLDEVGDLPAALQPRLLRALEQKEITPLGAAASIRIDVRVVSATNADLDAAVAAGRFRADLYSRLRAWTVRLPALTERREDVLRLARHFLAGAGEASTEPWDANLAEALLIHRWPYNVRELRQVALGLRVGGRQPPYRIADLPPELRQALSDARSGIAPRAADERSGDAAPPEGAIPDRDTLLAALEASDFNISAVGRQFGRDRRQVYRWMERHGIDRPERK